MEPELSVTKSHPPSTPPSNSSKRLPLSGPLFHHVSIESRQQSGRVGSCEQAKDMRSKARGASTGACRVAPQDLGRGHSGVEALGHAQDAAAHGAQGAMGHAAEPEPHEPRRISGGDKNNRLHLLARSGKWHHQWEHRFEACFRERNSFRRAGVAVTVSMAVLHSAHMNSADSQACRKDVKRLPRETSPGRSEFVSLLLVNPLYSQLEAIQFTI